MKTVTTVLVGAACLAMVPAALISQDRAPLRVENQAGRGGTIIPCTSLEFSLSTPVREGTGTSMAAGKPAPGAAICRRAADATALQYLQDATTNRRIAAITLSAPDGLSAALANAFVSSVRLTAENGQGVALIGFSYQRIELSAGGTRVAIDTAIP